MGAAGLPLFRQDPALWRAERHALVDCTAQMNDACTGQLNSAIPCLLAVAPADAGPPALPCVEQPAFFGWLEVHWRGCADNDEFDPIGLAQAATGADLHELPVDAAAVRANRSRDEPFRYASEVQLLVRVTEGHGAGSLDDGSAAAQGVGSQLNADASVVEAEHASRAVECLLMTGVLEVDELAAVVGGVSHHRVLASAEHGHALGVRGLGDLLEHLAAVADAEAVAELVEHEHAPAGVWCGQQGGEHELDGGELLLCCVGLVVIGQEAPVGGALPARSH